MYFILYLNFRVGFLEILSILGYVFKLAHPCSLPIEVTPGINLFNLMFMFFGSFMYYCKFYARAAG